MVGGSIAAALTAGGTGVAAVAAVAIAAVAIADAPRRRLLRIVHLSRRVAARRCSSAVEDGDARNFVSCSEILTRQMVSGH